MKYTELTIGDGIVSQIGSLLMAMSAGVIVTRVFDGSDDNVAVGIFKELMQNSVVVYTLAAMFILMGVFSLAANDSVCRDWRRAWYHRLSYAI